MKLTVVIKDPEYIAQPNEDKPLSPLLNYQEIYQTELKKFNHRKPLSFKSTLAELDSELRETLQDIYQSLKQGERLIKIQEVSIEYKATFLSRINQQIAELDQSAKNRIERLDPNINTQQAINTLWTNTIEENQRYTSLLHAFYDAILKLPQKMRIHSDFLADANHLLIRLKETAEQVFRIMASNKPFYPPFTTYQEETYCEFKTQIQYRITAVPEKSTPLICPKNNDQVVLVSDIFVLPKQQPKSAQTLKEQWQQLQISISHLLKIKYKQDVLNLIDLNSYEIKNTQLHQSIEAFKQKIEPLGVKLMLELQHIDPSSQPKADKISTEITAFKKNYAETIQPFTANKAHAYEIKLIEKTLSMYDLWDETYEKLNTEANKMAQELHALYLKNETAFKTVYEKTLKIKKQALDNALNRYNQSCANIQTSLSGGYEIECFEYTLASPIEVQTEGSFSSKTTILSSGINTALSFIFPPLLVDKANLGKTIEDKIIHPLAQELYQTISNPQFFGQIKKNKMPASFLATRQNSNSSASYAIQDVINAILDDTKYQSWILSKIIEHLNNTTSQTLKKDLSLDKIQMTIDERLKALEKNHQTIFIRIKETHAKTYETLKPGPIPTLNPSNPYIKNSQENHQAIQNTYQKLGQKLEESNVISIQQWEKELLILIQQLKSIPGQDSASVEEMERRTSGKTYQMMSNQLNLIEKEFHRIFSKNKSTTNLTELLNIIKNNQVIDDRSLSTYAPILDDIDPRLTKLLDLRNIYVKANATYIHQKPIETKALDTTTIDKQYMTTILEQVMTYVSDKKLESFSDGARWKFTQLIRQKIIKPIQAALIRLEHRKDPEKAPRFFNIRLASKTEALIYHDILNPH